MCRYFGTHLRCNQTCPVTSFRNREKRKILFPGKLFLRENAVKIGNYFGMVGISVFLSFQMIFSSPIDPTDIPDKEIMKKYQKILLQEPSNLNAHFNLGILLYRNAHYNEAIREFNKVIEINPNDAEAYYNLGNIYNKTSQYDNAVNAYKKALAIQPRDAAVFHNIGNAFTNKGMIDDAITYYQMAVEIDPGLAESHKNMAYLYKKKGRCLKIHFFL